MIHRQSFLRLSPTGDTRLSIINWCIGMSMDDGFFSINLAVVASATESFPKMRGILLLSSSESHRSDCPKDRKRKLKQWRHVNAPGQWLIPMCWPRIVAIDVSSSRQVGQSMTRDMSLSLSFTSSCGSLSPLVFGKFIRGLCYSALGTHPTERDCSRFQPHLFYVKYRVPTTC